MKQPERSLLWSGTRLGQATACVLLSSELHLDALAVVKLLAADALAIEPGR